MISINGSTRSRDLSLKDRACVRMNAKGLMDNGVPLANLYQRTVYMRKRVTYRYGSEEAFE